MMTIVVDGIVIIGTDVGTKVPGMRTGLVGSTDTGGIGRVTGAEVGTGEGTGITTVEATDDGTL
jgi:hypothetical protein